MSNEVIINLNETIVTIADTDYEVTIERPEVDIVSLAEQGPQGTQGYQGPQGNQGYQSDVPGPQ